MVLRLVMVLVALVLTTGGLARADALDLAKASLLAQQQGDWDQAAQLYS